MADLATLNTRLAEAELALHDLLTGKRRASVTRSGTQVNYYNTAESIEALKAYIAELRNEIRSATTGRPRRMIMNNWF